MNGTTKATTLDQYYTDMSKVVALVVPCLFYICIILVKSRSRGSTIPVLYLYNISQKS
jgi:hypothetical protein